MPKLAAGREGEKIIAPIAFERPGPRRAPKLRRACNSLALGWRWRFQSVAQRRAQLDFDEAQGVDAQSDQVDLTQWRARAQAHDPVAFEHQKTRSEPFGQAAALFGNAAMRVFVAYVSRRLFVFFVRILVHIAENDTLNITELIRISVDCCAFVLNSGCETHHLEMRVLGIGTKPESFARALSRSEDLERHLVSEHHVVPVRADRLVCAAN